MIQKLDDMKKQFSQLATILNAFESEAVQLRVLDFIFGNQSSEESNDRPGSTQTPKRRVSVGPQLRKKPGAQQQPLAGKAKPVQVAPRR